MSGPSPWILVVPPEHRCPRPLSLPPNVGVGSIWACPHCGRKHLVVENSMVGPKWQRVE